MLKTRIQDDMKIALKAGEKPRLGVIRLIFAAVRQREIDERIELTDDQIFGVLEKMVKQRRESMSQYQQAGREDLAAQERFEIEICQGYLPDALSEAEVDVWIAESIAAVAATSVKEMGRVMAILKPKLQGRADLAAVGAKVRARLAL
ncbi:MAG: GatB/YqeY domain-containing protein [Pseudomonadota bacterium]